MAPSLVIDCYNNDTYCVTMLQNLKFIVYGGVMLPGDIGDVLCQRIRLTTLMGSCETALLPHQIFDDPRDWEYISLSPCLGSIFRVDRDGLGNLTIIKQKKSELYQGVFSTFPHKEEHALGDLFEPHPLKPGLWRFRARADDIISFTTAEKLNPSTMESTIQANPLVKSAVIGGQGQFQVSILLEPREYPRNAIEEQAFLDQPVPRASKDTVQRHAVFKLYEAEWKALYERLARFNHNLKEPVVESSDCSRNSLDHMSETDDGAILSDKMTLAIEVMVEQKVSAALDLFASALRVAASQLHSTNSSAFSPTTQGTKFLTTRTAVSSKANGFANGANGRVKDSVNGRLRQITYNTIAENLKVDDLKDDTDLFKFGLDSLLVPSLLNAINAFIVKSEQPVDLIQKEAIYSNPTVAKLFTIHRYLDQISFIV